ncbi:inner membrane protein YhjD [Acerihabitans sp. TG2]|nr:inner membrane protein YhjD [Acerihabitans sp. TG2]MEA9389903.1 inner membrane protein YhjD [Acerihabitans sp. TG2]
MAGKPRSTAPTQPLKKSPPGSHIHTGIVRVDNAAQCSRRFIEKISAYPPVAHIIRAVERFNDRMGSQFGAAITYFSFLSMIPILMVTFAGFGFFLASNPDILTNLINKIADSISDQTLADTLKNAVNTAIAQRTTVGITGLLIALYSGLNWVGNLREAIRAQLRKEWERNPQDEEKFYYKYLRDLVSLIGLIVALMVTLSLTSIAGVAQDTIVTALGLDTLEWLRPAMTIIGLTISIIANYLLFLWIFWVIPRHKSHGKAIFRGALLAAIGFEAIKFIMTISLPKLATSPSGAAFGSVIGLMAFFYFFARLTLFCAAWIATAPADPDKNPHPPSSGSSGNNSSHDDVFMPAEAPTSATRQERPLPRANRRVLPRTGSAPYLMALTTALLVYSFSKS